jgi:hypothetical protein
MDDMHISTVGTLTPSFVSTPAPTDDSSNVTSAPTSKPTFRPTVATLTMCPNVGFGSLTVSPGPIMLGKSSYLCILTKAIEEFDGSLAKIAPVARSYDGRAWEPSSGEFATHLFQGVVFGDYIDATQINLPELAAGEKYYLTSYSYVMSHNDAVARLFETATFGTTTADLVAWDKGTLTKDSVSGWIHEQISKPITSHREFFRLRVNPRVW